MPVRRPRRLERPEPVDPLPFCANCQVSVPLVELEHGAARRTPRGRVFCGVCARATPADRLARRRALEAEFADDAPIPPAVRGTGRRPRPAATAPPLEQRVARLEQVVLRLQARLQRVERA